MNSIWNPASVETSRRDNEDSIKCGETTIRNMTVGGDCVTECDRRFMLYLPSIVCDANVEVGGFSDTLPVVFSVHRLGGALKTMSGWTEVAEQYNFVWVNPEGIEGSWNAGGEACCGDALERNVDDVGFFRTVLETVRAEFPFVSTDLAYAMGWSNGAYMVSASAQLFRAISPISGYQVENLRVERPTALLLYHSLNDNVVQFTGCCTNSSMPVCCCGLSNFTDQCTSAPEKATEWAYHINGCAPDVVPQETYSHPGEVTCYTFLGCEANTSYCVYDHKGHFGPQHFHPKSVVSSEIATFFATDACSTFGGHWSSSDRNCTCSPDGTHDGIYCLYSQQEEVNARVAVDTPDESLGIAIAACLLAVAWATYYWRRRNKRYDGFSQVPMMEMAQLEHDGQH